MPAAPKKRISLSRPAPRLKVRLGQLSQNTTASDEIDFLVPLRIERSAGGSRVDTCTLAYLLDKTQERIVDTLTPQEVDRQIEVIEVDDQGQLLRVLFWGKLSQQQIALGSTETLQVVARLDPHLYGIPLGRVPFWDPLNSEVIDLDKPLTFNPQVDGEIRGNRSEQIDSDRGDLFLLFDAFAVDTLAARLAHGQTVETWKVFQAVHFLCWLLNPDETYVKNPTLAECESAFKALDPSDTLTLRNLTISPGAYLPSALDQLLTPLGCGWYTAVDDASVVTARTLKFFRRNKGTTRFVKLQRPGERLDPASSNVADAQITFDVANLANVITGVGSYEQVESTFELFKCWPAGLDDSELDALEHQPALWHVGRKWVLNESGAWTGLRPEITGPTDLTSILNDNATLLTTRKFLPCLSRFSDGNSSKLESRGFYIEWWNPQLPAWEKVEWSASVLETECAVWFETVPPELWAVVQDNPANARIRITATIEGDRRIHATATRQTTSPNIDPIELRLDLADKFHSRQVHSDSVFYGQRATADEADDQARLQAYVEQVRANEDAAQLSCSIVLEGIDHPEYGIGDLVEAIEGRGIQLNRNAPGSGTVQHLQIMGLNLDVQGQRTELLLETFDEELQ